MRTVKVPTFDGKEENYQRWLLRFKAYSKLGGFTKAISTVSETDLPADQAEADALTGTDAATQNKIKAVTRNDIAIASLTLAFTTDEMLSLIMETQTDEWPDRLAYNVVKQLEYRYRPSDTMALVDERIALNKISMKKKEDPKKLFERIKEVETRYNTKTRKIKEEDKMAVVLSEAPAAYQAVLTAEQRAKGTALTMDDLQEAMGQHYRMISHKEDKDDEDDELVLSYFDGKCNKYKKHGHRAKDCRAKKTHKKKFNGACNECGKHGHKAADCWSRASNTSRRPNGWRGGARNIETSNVHADGPPEIVLTVVDKGDEPYSHDMHELGGKWQWDEEYADESVDSNDETDPNMPTLLPKYEDNSSIESDEEVDDDTYDYKNEESTDDYGWNLEEAESEDGSDDEQVPALVKKEIEDNTSVDTAEEEPTLANLCIPADFKLLSTPNLWIVDTGATIHNTPHENRMSQTRKGTESDSVMVGNGERIKSTTLGSIRGLVTTRKGEIVAKVTLTDVACTPDSKFNLLSITKMMSEGWTVTGNSDHLSISKGNVTLTFDIIIRTQRGKLFCINIQ